MRGILERAGEPRIFPLPLPARPPSFERVPLVFVERMPVRSMRYVVSPTAAIAAVATHAPRSLRNPWRSPSRVSEA